jgi:ABC-type branched-subunit amino acid transport system substrate-binding protein
MVPAEVMAESRARAQEALRGDKPVNWAAAAAIVAVWLLLAALAAVGVVRLVR